MLVQGLKVACYINVYMYVWTNMSVCMYWSLYDCSLCTAKWETNLNLFIICLSIKLCENKRQNTS